MPGTMTICKQEVVRIAQERRYNLQETLVHALFQRIAAYRGVKALRIKSVKPDVYPDAKASESRSLPLLGKPRKT